MHVRVNAAVSADGKLSTRRREQVPISGPEDFARVDELRAEADAVLVGVGTVLADDPHLTVERPDLREARRERDEPEHPARVIADSRARTPAEARILDDAARTFVLVSDAAPTERRRALSAAGAELIGAGEDRVDLPAAFAALEERGVEDLMIEGGGELLFSCFEAGLVDECSVFVGEVIIGGRDAPTLTDGEGFVDPGSFVSLSLSDVRRLDDGVLLEWDVEEPNDE